MHSPRSRIRGRDPHPHPHPHRPSDGGRRGRHSRRSPPALTSPRYQCRPQRPTPPPRRGGDPHIDVSAAAHHRILLEAGRLAAHYLVAQGVIPEHVLRDREDPPAPRPAHPPPASRGRKLDDSGGGGGDPRSRRNDGDCARAWEDDDRQARKSTRWDRRSQSFDDRRRYHDAGHDVDRGARRTRDYDEPRRPPMSRSYSHNDRRPSSDGGRVDPRSRSRSRSRSRTRSYYAGSGSSRDLDHTKVPDSATAGGDCAVEMPRKQQRRVRSSLVVAEVNDSADQTMAIEDGEVESEIHGLNNTRDISESEDGEFEQDISEGEDGELAAARLNGVEMDATQHQLSDSDTDVHPLESAVEPAVHTGSQLSSAIDDREAANAPMAMDASTRETLGDDNDCSKARDEMVPPHPPSEGEAGAGGYNRDKPELPASCRIFYLNVVETPDACEISGDPRADHVSDLVGQIHQRTNCHASEIQGQVERAGDNHMLKNEPDLIRYDLNSEAVDDSQDIHLLENEKLLRSHGIDAHDTTKIQRSNGHLHLNRNADELEYEYGWMENHTVIASELDPSNENARQNIEVTKKKLAEQRVPPEEQNTHAPQAQGPHPIFTSGGVPFNLFPPGSSPGQEFFAGWSADIGARPPGHSISINLNDIFGQANVSASGQGSSQTRNSNDHTPPASFPNGAAVPSPFAFSGSGNEGTQACQASNGHGGEHGEPGIHRDDGIHINVAGHEQAAEALRAVMQMLGPQMGPHEGAPRGPG